MNWALALTWLRILLTPVFPFVFLFWDSWWGRFFALAIAVVCELTDMFDGMVARRFNQVTDLGKLLDPLADSISRLTIFICFAQAGICPLIFVLLLLYRDSLVSTIRTVCAYRGKVVAARVSGKIKAVVQATVILIILFGRLLGEAGLGQAIASASFWLMGAVVAVTVWSAFDYFLGNRESLGVGGQA